MVYVYGICLTRYRAGSHNLKIESGRIGYNKVDREFRICSCGNVIQTLQHCLRDCPLLHDLRVRFNISNNIEDASINPNTAKILLEMERVLSI